MADDNRWFTAFDEATGEPYFYNAQGDVTWDRPVPQRPVSDRSEMDVVAKAARTPPLKPPKPQPARKTSKLSSFMIANRTPKKKAPAKPSKPVPLCALYTFKAGAEGELSFKKGAKLTGIRVLEGNEWWEGTNKKGTKGIFPCAYVEPIKEGPGIPKPPKPVKPARKPELSLSSSPSFKAVQAQESFKTFATGSAAITSTDDKYRKKSPLQFTIFAHNLGYASSFLLLVLGVCGLYWIGVKNGPGVRDAQNQMLFNLPFAVYTALASSLIVFVFEFFHGLSYSKPMNFPVRPVMYTALGLPCFLSYTTMLAGVSMLFTAAMYGVAYQRKERGDVGSTSYLMSVSSKHWSTGQSVFLFSYFGLNIFLWIEALVRWQGIVKCDGTGCPSSLSPFAKAFGQTLNFNCAIILVPVLKTLLTKLNNIQITSNSNLANLFPLRKNIAFHKVVAMAVFIGALGHIVFHFLNFAQRPEATIAVFGYLAWFTGALITLVMVIMYAGAQQRVRKANFEIFWNSHKLYILFFALLLVHGPVYWIWSALPVVLFLVDFLVRRFRTQKQILLHTVKWSPPVMSMRFFPQNKGDLKFKEGQYLKLLVNQVSRNEWHPFTISSAYDDLDKDGYISLHIRVMDDESSWTHQTKEFFKLLSGTRPNPRVDEPFFLELKHFDNNGNPQRGKYLGPDGNPLIMVDGPHAAPAQHYDQYSEVMLIGAGIGLTPCAAIIKSILKYKWKKGFNPQHIRFYWVVRHAEIESFRWFIKLLTKLQRRVIADRLSNSITGHHHLEINLYVTSAPKTQRTTQVRGSIAGENAILTERDAGQAAGIEAGYDVDIGFSDKMLTLRLLNPQIPSSEQAPTQRAANMASSNASEPVNKLKDIWIWEGRPDWGQIFAAVAADSNTKETRDVGVAFCGTPVIGKDLRNQCRVHSDSSVSFHLHKEKF